MSKCRDCRKEMLTATGCDYSRIMLNGEEYHRSTEYDASSNGRCHDCNAVHGNYHHLGCDVERCPKCGGHLISCGCLADDNDEESWQLKR